MSINPQRTSASHSRLEWVVLAFAVVSTIVGVATVGIVYRTMSDFRAELMQRAEATRDQPLLDLIAHDANTMNLVLAAIVLVATLKIAAGVIVLRRGPE